MASSGAIRALQARFQQRCAITLLCAGWILAGCDYTEVKGLNAAMVLDVLPGVARIFLGPDYLGESSFPLLRQGDSTTLNLGIDPNLIVEYEVVLDQREEPGLFSSELCALGGSMLEKEAGELKELVEQLGEERARKVTARPGGRPA